jgi:dihydrofolate reductase
MRKIVVSAFVSVDGVMQAPGGPEEDTSGGFELGGWTFPFFDETVGGAIGEMFAEPFDLLLGRKTYDIFAAHWPKVAADPKPADEMSATIAKRFDAVTKYVLTHRADSLEWVNSKGLGADPVATLRALKKEEGSNLLTQGSSEVVHLLLANDLVDELRLIVYPAVLGKGKRLFDGASVPRTLRLVKSKVAANGTIIATYAKGGEVKTGSFAKP